MAGKYDFDLPQGATFNRSLVIKDADGTVLDLTGNTLAGQIRTTAQSSTVSGTFAFVITDASNGLISWKMTSTNTALLPAQQCVYDVELTQANGDIIRILEGNVNVTANVTR
jgi:hypothetical protein